MEWGNDEVQELIITLTALVASINMHQNAIEVMLGCIEQLDARSQVTTSIIQSLTARLEKLENC